MKHHSPWTAAALLVLALITLGCIAEGDRVRGSGVLKSETRTVGDFEQVNVEGSADVKITVGQATQLSIAADDNILPLIETEVKNDKLVIRRTQPYSSKLGVKVTISVPKLTGVSINGSGDVDATGIDSERFGAAINGSGDLMAAGTVQNLDVAIRGSGDVNFQALQAKSAAVAISGAGDVTVNASDELSVSIAGSGDVKYKGSPQIKKNIAGSGSVRQI